MINRGDVYLVNLDPTVGTEIRKTRPAVVLSPNEVNHNLHTVIIAPMTTQGRLYPTRVACRFNVDILPGLKAGDSQSGLALHANTF